MIVGLIFLAFTVAVQGQTTDVETCQLTTDAELPINAYIEGCTTPPCLLPQLQDAVINIVFQAPRTMTSMRTLAAAIVHLGIISMPAITYPLGDNALTCNFLTNSYCPVLAGEVLQYTLKMFIESSFLVLTCNFLTNSYCPVLAGEVLQYTLKMFIALSFFVGTRATIEFKVVDEADQSVICIRVPITITPSVA